MTSLLTEVTRMTYICDRGFQHTFSMKYELGGMVTDHVLIQIQAVLLAELQESEFTFVQCEDACVSHRNIDILRGCLTHVTHGIQEIAFPEY
jgi:hypothetical protein